MANKDPEQNGRLNKVPRKDFTVFGFGLSVLERRLWEECAPALRIVRTVLVSGALPPEDETVTEALRLVQKMFSRVYTGTSFDWFSASRLLGHPSAYHCRYLAKCLKAARENVRRQNAFHFEMTAASIARNHGIKAIDNALGLLTRGDYPINDHGWAYILWSSSERDALNIGVASGKMESVVARLNEEHPGSHPYGIMAAWRVDDGMAALGSIETALDDHALGDGFYRIELGTARDIVQSVLAANGLVVRSVWDRHESRCETFPIMTSAPTPEWTSVGLRQASPEMAF
jgi:hypothetical protein